MNRRASYTMILAKMILDKMILATLILGTIILAIGLMALIGCTSARPSVTSFPAVVAITPTSGTPQSHTVNGTFGVPLIATVTSNGLPASGIVVTFRAPSTGASGNFAGSAGITTTSTTDSNGIATPTAFSANGIVGAYTVTASAAGAPTLASFSLTNTTGGPATISATGGSPQSAAVNTAFASRLVSTVVDVANNPVSGAIVVFQASTTGPSGLFADTGTATTTATTNGSGVATSTVFTANGIAGADTVTATTGGVSAGFTLTNLAGPPSAITAASGTPQSTVANTLFTAPFAVVAVDSLQNPVAGAVVTFTAPTTGASGTFTDTSTNTTTATTSATGIAISTALTANSTAGAFAVTATVAGASGTATFSLTNWPAGSRLYSFSLRGQEASTSGFYALAGSVVVGPTGTVIAGEQDYNDAEGITSPQPTGDTITGGSLSVNALTRQGTLTLNTSNTSLGVSGLETLGIQFVNPHHAMIMQFDGISTSSGSMDLQTLTTALSGGYAFTLSGVDLSYLPINFGGVFSVSGTTLQNGLIDVNDAGTVTTATALTGTLSSPDSFGRGTITGFSYLFFGTPQPIALNYYVVGAEAVRIINVDSSESALGSAYGQGVNATAATNASLGTSVFGIAGNSFSSLYGAAGMFSTDAPTGTFSGVADDNEVFLGIAAADATISGTYSIASTGYGSLTIASGTFGDITALGIYLTDPNLNLNDPNNTTTGLGGALVTDLDALFAGGVGLMISQTDTSTASFTGNYAFGAQDFNDFCCEFDFAGRSAVNSGVFSGIALVSDPFFTLGASATNTGALFSSTPLPDPVSAGRYTMLSTNTTPNPLAVTITGITNDFDVVIYQASGGELLWLDVDAVSVFLGSLQQ